MTENLYMESATLDPDPLTYASVSAEKKRYPFPPLGDKLCMEVINERYGKLNFSIRWSSKDATPSLTFNLAWQGQDLCRLETGGTHRNPSKQVPDSLLERFKGYYFAEEPHLHLYFPGRRFEWAVPVSVTDFFCADPVGNLLRAFELYCRIEGRLPIDVGLFENEHLDLYRRPHFKETCGFL
jgi:hypothetical protein